MGRIDCAVALGGFGRGDLCAGRDARRLAIGRFHPVDQADGAARGGCAAREPGVAVAGQGEWGRGGNLGAVVGALRAGGGEPGAATCFRQHPRWQPRRGVLERGGVQPLYA